MHEYPGKTVYLEEFFFLERLSKYNTPFPSPKKSHFAGSAPDGAMAGVLLPPNRDMKPRSDRSYVTSQPFQVCVTFVA